MTTSLPSQVWQNYHQDLEAAINRQINMALNNFAKYFLLQCHENREHAEKLLELPNQGGGQISLKNIKKLYQGDWESGLNAMKCALHVKKKCQLHKMVTDKNDLHLCDFIETQLPG